MSAAAGDKQARLAGSQLFAGAGLRTVDDFTDRQWLFEAIDTWRKTTADRIHAVVGPPGTGKTSLFAELAYRQAMRPAEQRWLSAAWKCSDHRAGPLAALTGLAQQFCVTVPGFQDALLNPADGPLPAVSKIEIRNKIWVGQATESTITGVEIHLHGSSTRETLDRLLRSPLAELAPASPLIVALDSLDEAVTGDDSPTLVQVVLQHAAELPIRFVISSRIDPRIWQSEAAADIPRTDVIRDAPPEAAEVADYVRRRLTDSVPDAEQRSEIARLIQTASAGNFLYAYYATETARLTGTPPDVSDLPKGLTGWYQRLLERELRPPGNAAAENRWNTVIRPCLELILACRSDGFRADDIARMAPLPAGTVGEFYGLAGQYLDGDQDGVWAVYHRSFAQFLSDGPHPLVDRRDGDRRIADAADREWGGNWRRCTDHYLLEHLPFHVVDRHRLYDLLTGTDFPARQAWLIRSRPASALGPARTFRAAIRIALAAADFDPAARLLLSWSATQRLITARTPADLALLAGIEEALEATAVLPPQDALIWQLLIGVFLLESGREDEADRLIQGILESGWQVIPDADPISPVASHAPAVRSTRWSGGSAHLRSNAAPACLTRLSRSSQWQPLIPLANLTHQKVHLPLPPRCIAVSLNGRGQAADRRLPGMGWPSRSCGARRLVPRRCGRSAAAVPIVVLDIRWHHDVMGSSRLRLTKPTLAVLQALADASPDDPLWGLRICELADLGSGTVYPILERLSDMGWIDSWQEVDQPSGRPRRRYYRFTPLGERNTTQALSERASRRPRPFVAEQAASFLSQVTDGRAR